jgi:MFS family permease
MRSRVKSLLPWFLFGVIILLTLVQVGLFLAAEYAQQGPLILATFAVYSLIPIVSASVGALIVSRQPRNRIGWLTLLLATLIVLESIVSSFLANFDVPPPDPSLAFYLAAWHTGVGWALTPVTIFFIVLLFPTGRRLTRRWRWVVAFGLGVAIYTVIVSSFGRGWEPFEAGWFLANPLAILPEATLYDIPLYELPLPFLPVIFALLCALSLIIRYRRAGIVERKQIKWFLFAGSLFVLILPLNLVIYLLELENVSSDLSNLLFTIGVLAFPLAIGIAILRYNLFDIDLIIRKTLIYSISTATLALVYFGVIIVLQSVFEVVSGQQSAVSIVISTLIIAALFAPLRRRVQDFIDRRFYRRRYDAEKTLVNFGQFVRDETDLEALTAELLRVTEETMQPEQATLWLNLAIDERDRSA